MFLRATACQLDMSTACQLDVVYVYYDLRTKQNMQHMSHIVIFPLKTSIHRTLKVTQWKFVVGGHPRLQIIIPAPYDDKKAKPVLTPHVSEVRPFSLF